MNEVEGVVQSTGTATPAKHCAALPFLVRGETGVGNNKRREARVLLLFIEVGPRGRSHVAQSIMGAGGGSFLVREFE